MARFEQPAFGEEFSYSDVDASVQEYKVFISPNSAVIEDAEISFAASGQGLAISCDGTECNGTKVMSQFSRFDNTIYFDSALETLKTKGEFSFNSKEETKCFFGAQLGNTKNMKK